MIALLVIVPLPATAASLADQAAIADGKQLSNYRCSGTAKPKLSVLPMRMEDFSVIVPLGLMAGGHVTPIDHMYFSPTDAGLGGDAYIVRAMADSRVVSIGTRPSAQAKKKKDGSMGDEYRLVFTMSCKLFYYYDLVTSLSPKLQKAYAAHKKGGTALDVRVKAGETIGRIGGQTLDFAVWDMDVRLKGFVVPDHYDAEPWKIHTVDPLPYVTPAVKKQMLSKYVRTAKPISGKIDYDVDGKLVGTWFQKGTFGYGGIKRGTGDARYYSGHLAFAPSWWDPTKFIVSIGNWSPDAKQFAVADNTPDPATVSKATGLVKYELVDYSFVTPDGNHWDNATLGKPLSLRAEKYSVGCLLVQMTGKRTLKVQRFQDKACADVAGFTQAAKMYER